MPSSRTDHLEPLPIPFGTKADGTAVHMAGGSRSDRCFWAVLSNEGARRIVAIAAANRDRMTLRPRTPAIPTPT